MASQTAAVQSYIHDHHLEHLIKDLVTTLLFYKPDQPVKFLVEALQAIDENHPDYSQYLETFKDIAQKVRKEPEGRKPRSVSFPSQDAAPSPGKRTPQPTPPPSSSSSPLTVNFNRKRRFSVSAESLKPSDDDKTDRVVIPKTDEQRMRIFSAIANNLLFRNLEADQRQEVMDAMFEKKVPKGEAVIKQGDEGDNFYVVDEGVFEIFVNGFKVVEIGAGGSFGELALMYNTPRAATVQAREDSVLWAVDRVTFRRIIMNNTFRKRKMYESFVRTVPILQSLEPEERVKVADALEPQNFTDGDNIIEEGDVGDCFYVIVNGEVIVTKKMKKKNEDGEDDDDASEEEVKVNSLGKGSYFGELALLTDKPRAATVTAQGDVECVCLDTKAFIRLLGPVTEILKRNAETYAKYANSIPDTPLEADIDDN